MKTLIATLIAAAALVGSQASAYDYDREFTLSWMNDHDDIVTDGKVLVNIDAQRTLEYIETSQADILTLNFQGSYVLKATGYFTMPSWGVLNITSTVDAVKTDWEKTFSVEGGDSITLCATDSYIIADYFSLLFSETAQGGTVKLGNSEVLFKGLVASKDALAMNEVGVVLGSDVITLVGKVSSSPVPEPATGTLSLLALAGLCARRRRK